jgi:hypothetical protein
MQTTVPGDLAKSVFALIFSPDRFHTHSASASSGSEDLVAMRSSVTSPSASLTAGKSAAAMGAMVGPAERRGWLLLAAWPPRAPALRSYKLKTKGWMFAV